MELDIRYEATSITRCSHGNEILRLEKVVHIITYELVKRRRANQRAKRSPICGNISSLLRHRVKYKHVC